MKNYEYDVYVSFTGADRALKNDLHRRLRAAGLVTYDSDELCAGRFREDYMQALDTSRVFLLILSDHLLNDPAKSGTGTLSEVRKELAMAYELEMRNELNIVALCLSDFFYFKNGYHEYGDYGWTYYTHTRGFSLQDGVLNEDGTLDDGCYLAIEERIKRFIKQRNEGRPVTSYAPRCDLADEKIDEGGEPFIGRDEDFREVIDAFRSGTEAVVLHGMGGNGKTRLARRVAAYLEEEHLMRVAQIIHIQESRSSRDAMSAIVESARYSPSVLASLHRLNESEKYEKKLSALCEVPENTLLVIDNLNRLTEGELRGIVSKTKCKLLITTRANIPSTKLFLSKEIREIPERFAKDIFAAHAGFIPEDSAFSKIYEWAGGHTITLCILAKTAAMHRMSTEELLELISTPSGIDDARVEFKHNEYGESDTVIGHLSNLFGFGDFSEGAKDILRSMCILAVGEIPLCDLCRVLGLKNYNDVNELIKYGWLETRMATDPRDGTEKEYIYIHPVVMHLIAGKLPPRLDTVMPMVGYILEATDTEAGASYAGIPYLAGAVFHALLVISAADGRLPRELFDRFVKLDRLIGDEKNTAAEVDALLKVVTDEADRATLTSYRDMIILEQHPARISVYDRYLSELMAGADDYKWVIRSLSVTGQYLAGIEEKRTQLSSTLTRALAVAMRSEDDLAVYSLVSLLLAVCDTAERKSIHRTVGKYIRERKKVDSKDSELILLETFYYSMKMTQGENGTEKATTMLPSMLNSFADGKIGVAFKMLFAHPVSYICAAKAMSRARKLPDDDVVGNIFRGFESISERLLMEGQFDMQVYLEIVISLHAMLMENGLTLESTAQAIERLLSLIKDVKAPKVMNALNTMDSEVDMSNITIGAISNLHISIIISQAIGGTSGDLERCRRFYEATAMIHNDSHPDVIYAAKKYIWSLAKSGNHSKAYRVCYDIYNKLVEKGELSAELASVAGMLIEIYSQLKLKVPVHTPRQIMQWFEHAVCNKKVTDYDYHTTLYLYTVLVSDCYYKSDIKDSLNKVIDEAQKQLDGAGRTTHTVFIKSVNKLTEAAIYHADLPEIERGVKRLAKLKKAKYLSARNYATVLHISVTTQRALKYDGSLGVDEKISLVRSSINKLIKIHAHHSFPSYMLLKLLYALDTDTRFPIAGLIKSKKLADEVEDLYNTFRVEYGHILNFEAKLFAAVRLCLNGGFSNFYGIKQNKYYKTLNSADKLINRILSEIFDPVTNQIIDAERRATLDIRRLLRLENKIQPKANPSPNDPCPCGSGKKYKKCCGAPVTGGDDTDGEKPEGEVDAKPEGEADVKPEGEADTKPEGEADAKPEGEVDAKPDTGE